MFEYTVETTELALMQLTRFAYITLYTCICLFFLLTASIQVVKIIGRQ